MEKKDVSSQIKLINQALNAAISSINLSKQLLNEIGGVPLDTKNSVDPNLKPQTVSENSTKDLPGIIGTFDGQFMVAEDGQKYQVPENYCSKSMIVFGDKLKMVEVNGEQRFKQIERVKRFRASGLLVKKEGRFHVVTSDGSYRVLSASVSHFNGKEGDEVHIILPLSNRHAPFAAVENIGSAKPEEGSEGVKEATNVGKQTSSPVQRIVVPVADTKKEVKIEKTVADVADASKKKKEPKVEGVTPKVPVKDKEKSPIKAEKQKVEKPEKASTVAAATEGKKPEKEKSNDPLIGEDELR